MKQRATVLLLVAALAILSARPAAAAPCAPGAVYDPACDVDHNGVINILDIQLISGHWNQSGVWTGPTGWSTTGDAGTSPGVNFVGTTDNKAFQIKVNGSRALLIEPTAAGSPNIVGGYALNAVNAGAVGATISGGGGATAASANIVADNYGVIVGGGTNRAGNYDGNPANAEYAFVGGGRENVASATRAAIGGGDSNDASLERTTIGGGISNTASAPRSTVGGGGNNTASGPNASVGGGALHFATGENARIGGGVDNSAGGQNGAVGGGLGNEASITNASVGGGSGNWTFTGANTTVPGGSTNSATGPYSFAAGLRAKATSTGSFVWADSTSGDFTSTGANTWRIRAGDGIAFAAGNASFGLYSTNDGVGNGLVSYSQTFNGSNWAALFASNSGTSPGLYANTSAGAYAGVFADAISVNGGCTGCTLMYVALNSGDQALQPGDIVATTGAGSPLAGSADPLLLVGRSDGSGLSGVVYRRVAVARSEEDGVPFDSVQTTAGEVKPGDYLLIVVQGVAQVRVGDDGAAPGQRLTIDELTGDVRALQDVETRGLNTPILGIALDGPDATTGLAPVLVTAIAN